MATAGIEEYFCFDMFGSFNASKLMVHVRISWVVICRWASLTCLDLISKATNNLRRIIIIFSGISLLRIAAVSMRGR
jgi:hypothetical protein